ncbi:unnamed protein product [Didymodactylos carnosus]|nr:unnamed protein product [Didymodactylos carnosus]CAF3875326.1 unnamed protein product [Didymodactylos carnosus]
MEELRYEDYQVNRKFPQPPSLFGSTNILSTSGTTTSAFNPSPFGTTAFGANPSTSTPSTMFGSLTNGKTRTNILIREENRDNEKEHSIFLIFLAPTTTAPFSFGANTASTNIFGQPSAITTTNTQFRMPTSSAFGAPSSSSSSIFGGGTTTNIFGNTANTSIASPFNLKPALTSQPSFGFGPTTSSAPSFSFPTNTSTSIFSQPNTSFGPTTNIFGAASSAPSAFGTTTSPFGLTTSTSNAFGTTTSTTPAFPAFNSGFTASGTNSIFGSSTTTQPNTFGPTTSQPSTNLSSLFPNNTSNTNTFNTNIFGQPQQSSLFNPVPQQPSIFNQPVQSATAVPPFSFAQTSQTNPQQPQMMMNNSNNIQLSTQQNQQAIESQRRFLLASLLDPYASRGIKDYKPSDQIKPPLDLIVVTSSGTMSSNIVTTSTATTTTPSSLVINQTHRKTASHPLVDIRFKLTPVSSSPSNNHNDLKSPNSGLINSPLSNDFSEEEEMILIGRTKLSKLRLSNGDFVDSNDLRSPNNEAPPSSSSLYPLRRLAELETLSNNNSDKNTMFDRLPVAPKITATLVSSSSTTVDTASAYGISKPNTTDFMLKPTMANTADNSTKMLPIAHSTPLLHKIPSPPGRTTQIQHQIEPPRYEHEDDDRVVKPSQRLELPKSQPTISSKQTNATNLYKNSSTARSEESRAYRLPKLSRSDYYMKPTPTDLKKHFNDQGQCFIKELTVGRDNYGSVTFYGNINVAGLDLDRLIEIGRHEVTVYPDDSDKPPVGEELNVLARITLLGVYPTDRSTRDQIIDPERINAMNYKDYLKDITKKFDGEFVDYSADDGAWTFTVNHFTRYGLDGSEDEFLLQKLDKQLAAKQQPQTTVINQFPIQQEQGQKNSSSTADFLDQTIAVNDSYTLSPKPRIFSNEQSLMFDDMEKENSYHPALSRPATGLSLLGLPSSEVEKLANSLFDDNDDDYMPVSDVFTKSTDKIVTSTRIIPDKTISPSPPLIDSSKAKPPPSTTTFSSINIPPKPLPIRVYQTLPKQIALIKGKYFRTNISDQLHYMSTDRLNEKRLILYNSFENQQDDVDNTKRFFDLHLSCSEQSTMSTESLPHFRVKTTPTILNKYIEFYTKLIDEQQNEMSNEDHINTFHEYTLQILELCRLLWTPIETIDVQSINQIYFEEQQRRKMLSDWLYQCVLSKPKRQQWIMQNFEFLSRGLLNDCVKYAMDEGDLRLTALINAVSGSNTCRDILRHCANEDIFDIYTEDFQKTIAILSGEFIIKGRNVLDVNRDICWEMGLALHMRYANSLSDSISTIVKDFELACDDNYWLKPLPDHSNEDENEDSILDMRWQLLKLFTDETYPLVNLFNVKSYTNNPFDYRLSWLLYVTLQSVGAYPLSNDHDTQIHLNYSKQLEQMGLWKMSIFVLLHINNANSRLTLIRECLNHHMTSECDITQDEQYLIDQFCIPFELIMSSKALRAENDKRYTNSVLLWLQAKKFRRTHDLYCNHIFHDTLLQGDYEFARRILEQLDKERRIIAHWNWRGGYLKQYVELLIMFEKIDQGNIQLSYSVHNRLLTHTNQLCDVLLDVINDKYLNKMSLVEIGRRLLSILSYALICQHTHDIIVDNEENFQKKLDIFRQQLLSSVPCSIPLNVICTQIESLRIQLSSFTTLRS